MSYPRRHVLVTFKKNNEIIKEVSFPLEVLGDNESARDGWYAEITIMTEVDRMGMIGPLAPWGKA